MHFHNLVIATAVNIIIKTPYFHKVFKICSFTLRALFRNGMCSIAGFIYVCYVSKIMAFVIHTYVRKCSALFRHDRTITKRIIMLA